MDNISPQQIVFETIKKLILELHKLILELNNQHADLEKKLQNRSNKINNYILENDKYKREIYKEIYTINENIKKIMGLLDYIDEYIKKQKMQFLFFKKCISFIKQFPGWIIAFATAVSTILTYLYNHFIL